jgi:hypothetical protein
VEPRIRLLKRIFASYGIRLTIILFLKTVKSKLLMEKNILNKNLLSYMRQFVWN